jgi:VIT1/CCC1 family predicted Fe2+/Mn2+ transporter
VSSSDIDQATSHDGEQHSTDVASRLNWLRAGVLGANDGIVSTAGLVVGVAGATTDRGTILTAGVAGLVAGALSMATGEYVSVSTQRDTERALLDKERRELAEMPDEELAELAAIYQSKGLTPELAQEVAVQLTEKDAFAAHVEAELGIDPNQLVNPWHAAFASAISFTVGALLPLIAIEVPPPSLRVPVTFVAVLLALVLTGWISAGLGSADRGRAVRRNVLGGALAMAVTYGIGVLVGGIGL